ncbi:DUF1467 domain-containing protein [Natronosalvus vescus]|uniref:DUF1467 domain-containing protein n=1 Tax=Natronosalvus vescus TaxID=2953881 RepID=UPI0020918381|nr:DUF1467 domain-containing protein [Natronosalvus vescus]
MSKGHSTLSATSLVASTGLVAIGVAINSGLEPSVRTVPALFVISIGLVGIVSGVSHRPLDQLRRSTKRWWLVAFVAFLPYGIVAAPSSAGSAALGEALSEVLPTTIFEAVAGATLLCAISITALYAMGLYGIHPGRPAPEDRLLSEFGDD